MGSRGRQLFLGIAACLVLIIYSLILGNIILSVWRWVPTSGAFVIDINLVWIVNLLGGLVSGVVIGNLAITEPLDTPLAKTQLIATSVIGKRIMQYVVWLYVLVWFIVGIASFYVGVIKCSNVSNTLYELGKAWLGILVGALYAYFGIKKPS